MRWRRRFTFAGLKNALWRTALDVPRKHTFQMAAAMAYYFVLSIFPALVLLSAIVSYFPVENLFDQVISLMSGFVPADSMRVVQHILSQVVTPNRGKLLSFGLLGAIWAASGGFASTIEALDVAYEVREGRPFWVTRPLAVGLTFLVGILMLLVLAVMILGPQFADTLSQHRHLSNAFIVLWPYIHWTVSFGFTVLAVEFLYFIAPNVKQRFGGSLPGAVLSVVAWVGLSYGLGVYFRRFAHLNRTYGAMGAVIALMIWAYWNSFVLLLGAELNCQLAKETVRGKIVQDQGRRDADEIDLAA